ncbi:exosome complex RNA-binding protein Csl4 [Thermococcus sp.]|uniref:exosome complex RNA-binding protein Csl4 n=1 Tax=Thermococcus sp. TaxID=35749 RepID=UPI00261B9357|nr:exosome complex RNA-binding protein Csl4 [Thermococcus sp.]
MNERKVKPGDIVLPGDYLGVIEEYFPGDGVKEENGELYAIRAGTVVIDGERMEISVEPLTDTPPLPKVGDVVIGQVIEVKPQTAIVQIIRIEGRENDREVATSKLAGIHISQVDESYVEGMLNEFRIGDMVRARVIAAEKSPIQLSTKGPDLGVIYALCTRCRTPLVRRGDKLVCPRCGHVETRKLSSMYRRVNP